MPVRRPPPPPLAPRRTNTRARSASYRVTNSTPADVSSSEDDLHTSSQPTSPTESGQPRSLSHEIPRIRIDEDVCGDERSCRLPVDRSSGPDADPMQTQVQSNEALRLPQDRLQSEDGPQENECASKSSLSAFAPSNSPPPVPPRPQRNRYRRRVQSLSAIPDPTMARPSPVTIPQQALDVTCETGATSVVPLEVQNKLNIVPGPGSSGECISVDVTSSAISNQSTGTIFGSAGHSHASLSAHVGQKEDKVNNPTFAGFYAPVVDSTDPAELEMERITHIVHFWNSSAWDQVDAYLTDYLKSLLDEDSFARARRVRHLLGVCASLKGEWERSIPLFLSVLRTPISDISKIDDGGCAAAYWLGDIYALLNKRTEALLAYCIAERSSLFHAPGEPALSECIRAEQDAVQLGISKADFRVRWGKETQEDVSLAANSILNTETISTAAAKILLENEPRRARRETVGSVSDSPFHLTQSRSRSNSLFCLNKLSRIDKFHCMKISTGHFEPNKDWPMMYDPLFAMANVQRGRLLAYECDLFAVFASNPEARIPKSVGLNRMDCFTCTDLTWLIRTIRECLHMLEMEFSEVANVEGTWFVARYTFLQDGIATTYYFSIALFRQTFRSGYGADICPDGLCSARIIKTDYDHDKGVHHAESKRIKKLIREYLDEAAKRTPTMNRKISSAAVRLIRPIPAEG